MYGAGDTAVVVGALGRGRKVIVGGNRGLVCLGLVVVFGFGLIGLDGAPLFDRGLKFVPFGVTEGGDEEELLVVSTNEKLGMGSGRFIFVGRGSEHATLGWCGSVWCEA